MIVDAHLDLAYQVTRGRDPRMPAKDQPTVTSDIVEIATCGLPDLHAGGVGLICATIFCAPDSPKERGYRTAEEAHGMGMDQLNWYHKQADAGEIAIVRNASDLPRGASRPSALILLEGADPIRKPHDVEDFFNGGVRIVGLAWKRTRYAGGTGAPGPLTAEGIALVRELDRFGIIHDASHLAEESFWQLLDLSGGPIMASHSNCRSIVPTDRQLSDDMIRAVAKRGGVIGIDFYDRFLVPPEQHAKRRAMLADVVAHLNHMCDVIGDADHVGIGTDMDGGLGRDQIPAEIQTSADLPRVADTLSSAGFADADVQKIMGENWIRFFTRTLPNR